MSKSLPSRFISPATVAAVELGAAARPASRIDNAKRLRSSQRTRRITRNTLLGLMASLLELSAMARADAPGDTRVNSTDALEEVIVTATRRTESAQQVPATMTVISGASLEERGVSGFQDYLTSIPALGATDLGGGQLNVGIRGVSNTIGTEYGVTDSVQTVGLYLNDIPISGAASLPDLDIYDLQRIEVLKGPQGALYGEGAMGGAIRMMVTEPDLTKFSAATEATGESISHGSGGYAARGVVNLPLITDELAVRAVVSDSETSGWINNVALNQNDINANRHFSARLLAKYTPTDSLTLSAIYLHDDFTASRFNEVNPLLGQLETDQIAQPRSNSVSNIYAVNAELRTKIATWNSNTSYVTYDRNFSPQLTLLGIPPEQFYTSLDQTTFTQEFRAVSAGDGIFRWIAGAFYRDRKANACGDEYAPNDILTFPTFTAAPAVCSANYPVPGQTVTVAMRRADETFKQTAEYGEASLNFDSGLRLFAGGRHYNEDSGLTQQLNATGVLAAISTPNTSLTVSTSGTVGRAGASYQINKDVMAYALWSQGYRSGGPNLNASFIPGVIPEAYSPDSLNNYEAGLKSAWLNGRLVANLAVSYIDWANMQSAQLVSRPPIPAQSYIVNAGSASIKGVEFEVAARPTPTLQIGFRGAYQEATFDKNAPGVAILEQVGYELPNAPKWTLSGDAEQRYPLSNGSELFARLDSQYVASQVAYLVQAGLTNLPESHLPSYAITGLRVGWRNERYEAVLFANNVFDRLYYVGWDAAGGGVSPVVARPRMAGVTIRATF